MYDCLGKIIIVKVFSHQMYSDFEVKNVEKGLSPKTFVVSANQIADNAASMAQQLYKQSVMREYDLCYYPPFPPRWSFFFEGCLTNKGAAKVLYEKIDDELILRQQH